MRASVFPLAAAILVACASPHRMPPAELPPPPTPLPASPPAVEALETTDDPSLPPPPRPLGDREMDTLRVGFWGCRVLGTRLQPGLSGRALLRARIGARGEVVEAAPERVEGLPSPVVQCLLDSLRRARFETHGNAASELFVPVDFSAPDRTTIPRTPVPTKSL